MNQGGYEANPCWSLANKAGNTSIDKYYSGFGKTIYSVYI